MLCPVCRTQMLTLEFAQIDIDYCRECGGAWLDSGEAKLIEISGPAQDDALGRFLAQLERQRQKEHPRRPSPAARRHSNIRPATGSPSDAPAAPPSN